VAELARAGEREDTNAIPSSGVWGNGCALDREGERIRIEKMPDPCESSRHSEWVVAGPPIGTRYSLAHNRSPRDPTVVIFLPTWHIHL
jgi:hypothetical protein